MNDKRERAAWIADKIVALGDYAKEAAELLRYFAAEQNQSAGAGEPVAPEDIVIDERDLLPCPFCGSEDVGVSIGSKGDGSEWRYIECSDCSACAEPEFWNQRAHPAPAGDATQGDAGALAEELRRAAHNWAQQCYRKGLGRENDIDGARAKFDTLLSALTHRQADTGSTSK